MKDLKIEDKRISYEHLGIRRSFSISSSRNGWFLSTRTFDASNEDIFLCAGIGTINEKLSYQKSVLGYDDNGLGYFPYCKTKGDLIKLIKSFFPKGYKFKKNGKS